MDHIEYGDFVEKVYDVYTDNDPYGISIGEFVNFVARATFNINESTQVLIEDLIEIIKLKDDTIKQMEKDMAILKAKEIENLPF